MRSLTPVALAALISCHVFESGTIALTCDELTDCPAAPDGDTDDDTAEPVELGTGLVLHYARDDREYASRLPPPAMREDLRGAWEGAVTGSVGYDLRSGQLLLATGDHVYGLPGNGEQARLYAGPGEEVVDATVSLGQLWMVTATGLYDLDLASGLLVERWEAGQDEWEDLVSVFADEDGLVYVLDLDAADGAPDLWSWNEDDNDLSIVAEDFATSRSPCGAGGFLGPDGAVFTCSIAGVVYALDDLVDATATSTDAEPTAWLNASVTDVVGCGWDPDSDRFVVVSASAGALAVAPDAPDHQVFPPEGEVGDPVEIKAANLY